MYLERDRHTICALATAAGVSAIAVVRVSGDDAETIVRAIAPDLPRELTDHHVYYTFLKDPADSDIIDEVMISYFAKGRSYTCEPSFEISCHGSPTVISQILRALVQSGARLAEKGEFTYRAFMNGRIDLLQAEGILDLIESQSPNAAKMAMKTLRGELSARLQDIEDDIIWVLAQLEANIDFSSEDIVIAPYEKLFSRLTNAREGIQALINSYRCGRLVKEGITVVIVGPPNVGKSSLFNRFAGEKRSIVSKAPGTTRDWVDFEKIVDGQRIRFVDSAGIRITEDEVEGFGIERSLELIKIADVAIRVVDLTNTEESELQLIDSAINRAGVPSVITVGNKCDLLGENNCPKLNIDLRVSASSGFGLDRLMAKVLEKSNVTVFDDGALVHNVRQFEFLCSSLKFLDASKEALKKMGSPELIAVDLQMSLQELMKIRGERLNDEISDRVFRDFCLGK